MVISPQSTAPFARKYAGGKGYNLFLLSRQGLPIPEWRVLSAKVFDRFKEESKMASKLDEILGKLDVKSTPAELNKASGLIRSLFVGTPISKELLSEIQAAYAPFRNEVIAVRSSALDEDSSAHSFAGQLSSFLFVKDWGRTLEAIRECWASAFSDRCLSYRLQNGLPLNSAISVAVVLQKMIASEKSGVLFTCDPLNGDPNRLSVNAVYGVGEGLVGGHLEGDVFTLDRHSGEVLHQTIVNKSEKFVASDTEAGCAPISVTEALRDLPSLNADELKMLHTFALQVEKYFHFPQDIEWAVADNRCYLLQSRPITTPVKNAEGILQIWDNSNIVESYGGITLPLSFSFAHHNYHWVYVQFLEILMVPGKEIRKMDYFLRNMLGLFYGRVYYNLLNWYKLTSILPGFKYNRGFMETMMGTDHTLGDEIADRIKPPSSQESLKSKLIRSLAGAKFFYFHVTIQKMVDDFLEYFHRVYNEYRHLDYSSMPADQIQIKYRELEERLLLEWKAPIVNDYLCMVHFGVLRKLTGSWLTHLGPEIQNDLLCGDGKLESAEPTRELIRMAAAIAKDESLKQLIELTTADDCMDVLMQSPHREFADRVKRYIDLYGFRCMNEMKLEEIDLYQDPKFLFVCLKNYLRSGQIHLETYESREKEIRAEAERKVFDSLKGWRKHVFAWSLHHARKAVRNRENTRFCRTRIYGVARAMFNGIGRDFAARRILDRPEDIHYLQMQDIWGALDGTLTIQNLKHLVDLRKREYAEYLDTEPTPRFLTRGPVYWQNVHTDEPASATVLDDTQPLGPNELKGTGACPGIIEGVAKVILDPKDDMELNGEILVTLRTDPGWIPLYPAARALLVERGGLLSHSAIVAREMGLPTVVGVRGLTKRIVTGTRLRINGETGLIEILDATATTTPETAEVAP